jgi:CRISPR/Cas system CSM-associated protein Csm5 (group 7 of RAMP superfamily)
MSAVVDFEAMYHAEKARADAEKAMYHAEKARADAAEKEKGAHIHIGGGGGFLWLAILPSTEEEYQPQ